MQPVLLRSCGRTCSRASSRTSGRLRRAGRPHGTARGVALQLGLELAELGAQPDDGLETRRAATRRARALRRSGGRATDADCRKGRAGTLVTMPGSVLVTGAAKGIGRAIAGAAGRRRLGDRLRDARARRRVAGGRTRRSPRERPAHWVAGDLSDASAPARLAGRARARRSARSSGLRQQRRPARPQAARSSYGPRTSTRRSRSTSERRSCSHRAFARQAPDGGAIVNVTSVHELVPRPGFVVYAAAKAALGMLTRGLALELAPRAGSASTRSRPARSPPSATRRPTRSTPEIPLGRPGRPGGGGGRGRVAALGRGVVRDRRDARRRRRAWSQHVVARPAG